MFRGPVRRTLRTVQPLSRFLAGVLAGLLVLSACGGGGSSGRPTTAPLSLLAWTGDFVTPSRPVLISPGGEASPVGPAFRAVDVIRADPSGARAAALIFDQSHQLHVFSLDGTGQPRQVIVPGTGRSQDLAWSPDGRYIAVVRESSAAVLEIESLNAVVTVDAGGRLSGPLTGEIWSHDSRRFAFGVAGGVTIIHLDGSREDVPFGRPLFNPAATLFAGWSPDGSILAFDPSTEIYYERPPGAGALWQPSIPAEPLHGYVEAVRAAADAAYGRLAGGTVSLTRSTAGGKAVLGVAWTSGGVDGGLQRGPFEVAVAVVSTSGDSATFTFGNTLAFAGLRDGALVDAVLSPKSP